MMLNCELEPAFNELITHIEDIFTSELGCQSVKKHSTDLNSPVERKNGSQLPEAIDETTPYALQQFLHQGRYSTNHLRKHLQVYTNEKIGNPDEILVADETSFLKQGKRPYGVKRQYSETADRIENCQIEVFLTYAN
jgi:SRSO17 transposase